MHRKILQNGAKATEKLNKVDKILYFCVFVL